MMVEPAFDHMTDGGAIATLATLEVERGRILDGVHTRVSSARYEQAWLELDRFQLLETVQLGVDYVVDRLVRGDLLTRATLVLQRHYMHIIHKGLSTNTNNSRLEIGNSMSR